MIGALRYAKSVFRLAPQSVDDAAERARERHRRAIKTSLTAGLAKGLSILTLLITTPITLRYLGPDRFGVWMTMASFVTILSFADFGIGNGIITAVARANGKQDALLIKSYVSSAFFIMTIIAISICSSYYLLRSYIHWQSVFNVSSPRAITEIAPSLDVLITCFALSIPMGLIQKVQMGFQRGNNANMWQCVGSALTLGAIWLAVHLGGGMPWLVLALVGAPLLANTLNSAYFLVMNSEIRPALACVSWLTSNYILSTGFLYFILQIAAAITFSSDNIIIAQSFGSAAVTAYAVPQRLFAFVSMISMMALSPLWPAYGEAIAKGDIAWVKATLRRSFLASILFSAALSIGLLLLGNFILQKWTGGRVTAPWQLLAALAAWQVIQTGGSALAMFLNGAHVFRAQVLVAVALAVGALLLKLNMVKTFGSTGVVLAVIVAYVIFAAIPYLFVLPMALRGISKDAL